MTLFWIHKLDSCFNSEDFWTFITGRVHMQDHASAMSRYFEISQQLWYLPLSLCP
jgi:hypothetical protein